MRRCTGCRLKRGEECQPENQSERGRVLTGHVRVAHWERAALNPVGVAHSGQAGDGQVERNIDISISGCLCQLVPISELLNYDVGSRE